MTSVIYLDSLLMKNSVCCGIHLLSIAVMPQI
jgi:hypothetical protein